MTITGRNAEALQKVADEILAISGREPLQIVGDLSDHSLPEKLITNTIEHFGQLDVLVNNAGAGAANDSYFNPALLESFDTLFNLNVRSVLALTLLAREHLEKTKGNIVNISSVVAICPFYPVYGSTKAALDMITKTSAKELGPKGIRVNSVNPGPVQTGFMRAHGVIDPDVTSGMFSKMAEYLPLRTTANGEDIANSILFLSNNRLARNISGIIMLNDTGLMTDLGAMADIGRALTQ